MRLSPARILIRRPRLALSLCLGLAAGLVCTLFAPQLTGVQSALTAWDVGAVAFIALILSDMRDETPATMRLRACRQDEGHGLILALAVAAAVASVAAVVLEVSAAKQAVGGLKALRLGFAFATVAVSWFLTHLFFSLHYAHEYFRSDGAHGHVGGLDFPKEPNPDFWDFLYAALVIGAASQTADVAFTSKTLRRIGSLHCVIAFAFNTAVLALGVNLAAGLV